MERKTVLVGQESVWDYPRPPRLESTARHLKIVFAGEIIAETRNGFRVLETSHPPVYYFPPSDVRIEFLRQAAGNSFCEWKGFATYYDVVVGDRALHKVAWNYPAPSVAFANIEGYFAFYAGPMDSVTVDEEQVTPQPGGFYGGWITSELIGPFKGSPGSSGW